MTIIFNGHFDPKNVFSCGQILENISEENKFS